jgi:hypothetical protein
LKVALVACCGLLTRIRESILLSVRRLVAR